ncbi:ABC transporter ATP-binding protein [Faecalibacillus faecis]|uniref:ABC transporter ATP-binding protein n=1 Tax=Faecalibacillus faecis TaxID=1982628 RepID=UPI002E7811A4|nr:ABC transporter ATP-binding protein [Faecalibacillus faecis]MEE0492680.1 ABC transporter ATP-binding protein [Faecalibacillus faecis]
MGYISQRTEMFSGTILDNITLFNCDITKERVIKVCKTVGIHDDIMNLEMGYNTFYGAEGISLSGGQIQKIGIARALLKNADVYLCDEIYASLDKESVQNIKNVILQLSKKHIVIVIDHINDNFLSENLVKIFVNDKLTLYKC